MTVSLALVVNPAAGGGKPARYLPRVTAVLDGAACHVSYTVQESTSLEHARALACSAARRGHTVVAFGGDGLAGALADAIAREAGAREAGIYPAGSRDTGAPGTSTAGTHEAGGQRGGAFGIIPAGRGNDFARTLGIPFDPAAAARLLLDGQPRPVDLISVAGAAAETAPMMVAGSVYLGIASVANDIANRARLLRGPAVYNLSALRALLGWKPTRFGVAAAHADGDVTSAEFRGYAVVVANTPYFGAGMKVAPGAHAHDGLLDIVIMRHAPKLTFVRALLKIKDGSHVGLSQVSTFRARTATVTVNRPLPAGADGELLPLRAPLRIQAVPAAVQVIAPRQPVASLDRGK